MSPRLKRLKLAHGQPLQFGADAVAEELRQSRDVSHNIRPGGKVQAMPSHVVMMEVLEGLVPSLFPAHLGPQGLKHEDLDLFVSTTLSVALTALNDQISLALKLHEEHLPPAELARKAENITTRFASRLALIRGILVEDLKAAQRRDPSANTISEILISSRGSTAIIYHRLAHALHGEGARMIARLISDLALASTGVDIHPGASIAPGFFIRNGTGVVIGATSVIGRNVYVHQGVTLGESELLSDDDSVRNSAPRHPIIGDNVVIHAGATILGRVTIGAGSIVYGNVFVTQSVPPGSVVRQASAQHGGIQDMN